LDGEAEALHILNKDDPGEKSARAKKRQGASMAKSKSVVRKKTKRPTAVHHVKSLRLPADLAQRIDRWAKAMGKDSHSEAMRHLLEIGLSAAKRKSKDG